ncbi:unnamed protein product [Clavelina lepadiformis]|uniref:Secreted protein n=1 Tax=Clavelina lepadiformis TaxID=159417 RepID=A0ABP0FEG2_CLALP
MMLYAVTSFMALLGWGISVDVALASLTLTPTQQTAGSTVVANALVTVPTSAKEFSYFWMYNEARYSKLATHV